jgi:hypothetical protein
LLGGIMSRLTAASRGTPRPSGACRHRTHNVTPEEDYRTALLSDSPDEGVRYLVRWDVAGNDPDAKLACGTPRAKRRAAAGVSLLRSLPSLLPSKAADVDIRRPRSIDSRGIAPTVAVRIVAASANPLNLPIVQRARMRAIRAWRH